MYNVLIDNGETSISYEFGLKSDAVKLAKEKFAEGAFSARVYHYTNGGKNCVEDLWLEQ